MTHSKFRGPRLSRQLPRRLPISGVIGALLCMAQPAWALDANALPTGGGIVAGSGSIGSSGNQMTIEQQSQRLITEWQSFNIGANAGVNFLQPSSSAVALARVLSNDPSQIYGSLNANGHVFLVNPNGVYFAPGANVNVGGLVASTLNISNDDFLAGRNRFSNNGGTASVLNAGSIAASGGNIALVGAQVVNDGVIQAEGGNVALAAGEQVTLDFHGDRLLMVSVDQSALAAQAVNNGLIAADGGTVIMKAHARDALMRSVVNNTGVIRARSIGTRDGVVVLDGGSEGVVTHTGTIDVSGLAAAEQGGTAKVLGDKVALLGEAKIDARGDAGGGTVRIGGSYKGEGSERNATATVIGDRAVIEADAITFGHGGEVIVWADGTARFFGRISARGGAEGGNGGFVETSGKEILEAYGSVDASAVNGVVGSWLLDPRNVTIVAATANGSFNGGSPNVFTPTGDTATVNVDTINNSLNSGTSVTITTGADGTQNGDITLDAAATISKTAGGEATLRLVAARDVNVNGKIISTSDKLHVVLNSAAEGGAGSVSIGAGGQVITNGGNITIGGGADPATGSTRGGGTTTNGFRMQGGGTNQSTGALLSAGAGNILINASGSTASGMTLQSAGYSTITTTSGTITINATAGGSTSGINMTTGSNTISSLSGDITLNGTGTSGNGITIGSGGTNVVTSQSGNITLRGTTTTGTDLNLGPSTGAVRIGTHSGATVNHDLTYTGATGGTITLEGDSLNLAPTGAGTIRVSGTGALVIQPRSGSASVGIGATPGGSNILVLDAARLANIMDGFASITIGRAGGTGAINVGSANFTDNLVLRGGAINFNGALNTGANNLSVQAAGSITQSGVLTIGGTTALDAGASDITLTNAGNDFGGAVSVKARNVQLTDVNALTLGTSELSGDLTLTAGGQIGQSGALTVAGALSAVSTLAGAGDATINNSGSATTQLGDIRVGNDFSLVTAAGDGNITQSGSAHLEIGRNLNVTGGGTLTAPSATNAIGGTDNSAGAGVVKVAQIGVVDLSTVDIGAGAGNLTTDASQTLNVQSLATGYNVTAAGAGSNAVNLNLANNIGGTITVRTGEQATVTASGAPVATGINQNGATINLGGAASFSTATSSANAGGVAGNIVLDGAGNQFAGALSLNGNDVTVNAQGPLQLGSVNAATFNVTAAGALTQAAAITATAMNVSVGAGNDITLDNAANNIGMLAFGSARNVSIANSGALDLGTSTVSGDLTLNTGGAITQSGAWTVAGNTSLTAGSANITLTNAGNDFGGSVSATGGNVALTDANALTLGTSNVGGNLTLNAGGQVAQSGALTVGGNLSVTTTHAAGNVAINNGGASATQLGDSLVGGNFTLTATGRNVTQANGTEIAVAGNFIVDAASGTMQADNVVGGADNSQPGTTVIKQVGVINLDNITATGHLSVSSLESARTFSGPAIGGTAVALTNAGNNIGGRISINTQAPTLNAAGPAVATGIVQNAGTTISVGGNANFNAAGGAVNLSNAGNSFGGNLSIDANQVTLANVGITGNLAIAQATGAALSNLTVGGAGAITGAGVTSLNGALQFGGNFNVGGGNGAVALAGDTAITTGGTGTVSFGTMSGGTRNLTIEAHDVALNGDWSGSGTYVLRPNTTAKTVGIGGGTGTFNLSAAEMARIAAANASQVTIGRADGTGAVAISAFNFDDALRICGGNTTLASGNYAMNGGLDIAANGNLSVPSSANVNISTVGAGVRLAATGNVTFNSGTATAINTNGGVITIASRSDDSASGYVDARNTTLNSGGGNITIGGGSAPGTGYAVGSTVNGVRLGNTTINSAGGNIVINGESGSTAGVGMGVSAATTINAGTGDITIRGRSDSGAGIALQSGAVSGGQTLTTTSGDINLIGTSASNHGIRLGSTSANTTITLATAGGNINLTGTAGGASDGLNIGAGVVTLQTAGNGALNLNGTATGTGDGVGVFSSSSTDTALIADAGAVNINGSSVGGSGVSVGPTTTTSGTTTSITTNSGNVNIIGTSTDMYGVNLTANGTAGARGTANISTQSGNITLNGTSVNNIGLRNHALSNGDTVVRTVNGNIAYIGASTANTAVSISPSSASGNVGSGKILATGNGNISISGDSIVLNGSRVAISGNGGTLTLRPLTAGTAVGFGSGTSGKLTFSDSELAAITGGFSTVYVGSTSAGPVELGITHGVANVVALSGAPKAPPASAPAAEATQEVLLQVSSAELTRLLPDSAVPLDQAAELIADAENTISIVGPNGCARGNSAAKCTPKRR